MTNVPRFLALLDSDGSPAVFHREALGDPCPCLTPEGFRSPAWHIANPSAPFCNEAGRLVVATEFSVKAFIQPAQSAAVRRLTSEYVDALFGEVRSDDHLGIFPISWAGNALDFEDWSQTGSEFVVYDAKRYLVVNANKIPDPSGGGFHHWEVGLRLIKPGRPGS